MYSTFNVSGSNCLACNNEVLKKLGTLQGVFGAEVDRLKDQIVVNHTDEVTRQQIAKMLSELGFNEMKENDEIETDEPSEWGCAL